MPVALDQTYDYLLPEDIEATPGSFVLVPFGPQSRIGVVWDTAVGGGGKPVPEKKLKAITAALPEVPPLPADFAALCRMGRALHALATRHGGAHDDGLVGGVRAGEAALRRQCERGCGRSAPHDAGAQARPRDRRRWPDPGEECARDRGGLHHRRDQRPHRSRQPGRGGDPGEAFRTPRSGAHHGRLCRCAGTRRARHARGSRRRLLRHAARRRHRLRQDGSLLRGGGTHAGAGPSGAHHAARDRAHQPVHGPLHRTLRLRAGRVAFRALLARARAGLARRGDGRSPRRGRRPLCAVPALQRARPHRRRRRARRRLQAGRPRALPGARHGGGARQPRQVPGDPVVGHAVHRESRQCPHRPLPQRDPARPLFRRRAARCRDHRHAQGAAREGQMARADAGHRHHGDAGEQAAGAAVSQPPRLCAPDPVPIAAATASIARSARPGWWSTAIATA